MRRADLHEYQHATALLDGRIALWPEPVHHPANSPAAQTSTNGAFANISTRDDATAATDSTVETVVLAVPDSIGRVRRRKIAACVVHPAAILDALANLGPASPAAPEIHALAAITRLTLRAIAEGRVVPRLDPNQTSNFTWAVGPWATAEASDLRLVADNLPPALRAEPIEGSPLRVLDAMTIVGRFADAVAHAVVATSAAHSRTHSLDPVHIRDLEARLVGTGPVVVGRVVLDDEGAELSFEARSRTDHSLRRSASEIWAHPEESADIGDPQPDMWLLRQYKRFADLWTPLAKMLTTSAPASIRLDDDEVADFLLSGMTRLTAAGLEVLLPRDLVRSLNVTAKVSAAASDSGGAPNGAFKLESLCEVTVTASLDGTPLTAAELQALIEADHDIVRIRNTFIRVDPRLAKQLQRRVTGAEALGAALGGTVVVDGEFVEVETTGTLADLVERVRSLTAEKSIASVDGLHAELRPYQQRGIAWLKQVSELVGGGILADDMGLGKTLQVIALHLLRNSPQKGATLVVGPATLVTNWERELAKFAPAVNVHRYHGPHRTLDNVKAGDVVISTYSTVRLDREKLAQHDWELVIADEAQHIKNHASATARAVRSIPAQVRLAVSGTPVENRLNDLWALTDWTVPGLLGNKTTFRRRFANPVEREGATEVAAELGRIIAPFVLRRTKSDPTIAPDLPPRTEIDHVVPLSTEQVSLYRAMTADILEQIEQSEGMQRRGLVLKLLTALKQICDHPVLWLDHGGPLAGRSGKLGAFDDLVSDMVASGDAVLVFTQYVNMGHLLTERLQQLGIDSQFLHGGCTAKARQAMIDTFQESTGPAVFIISIKAGGTGLNLTRANQVIHYDRWWNPAVENQASDRAWRIGQKRAVFVHRLTSAGTLEETIARELERKAALADAVVGTGEGWLSELDDFSLRSLVELSGLE